MTLQAQSLDERLDEIERKLDAIVNALGLGPERRRSAQELKLTAKRMIQERLSKHSMKVIK